MNGSPCLRERTPWVQKVQRGQAVFWTSVADIIQSRTSCRINGVSATKAAPPVRRVTRHPSVRNKDMSKRGKLATQRPSSCRVWNQSPTHSRAFPRVPLFLPWWGARRVFAQFLDLLSHRPLSSFTPSLSLSFSHSRRLRC